MTIFEPPSKAFDIASVIPLSLKEPVGLRPSYFKYTSVPPPIKPLIYFASRSGVLPSFKVAIGVLFVTGRNFLYLSITPFHISTFHPYPYCSFLYHAKPVYLLQRHDHVMLF